MRDRRPDANLMPLGSRSPGRIGASLTPMGRLGRRIRFRQKQFNKHPKLSVAVYRVLGLVLLFAFWTVAAAVIDKERTLPGVWPVTQKLWQLVESGSFVENGYLSLRRVALGFLLAFVVSAIVGIALGRSRTIEAMFGIYVFLALSVPGLAYAVIALILLGLNETAAVLAVAAAITPVLILNVWDGTKALDRDLVEMATIYKVGRWRMIRDVILPSLSPFLFTGARLGLSQAWKLVVVVELLALSSGVGYGINFSFNNFDMAGVLAWTLGFSIVMAIIEFALLRPVEARILRWRPDTRGVA